MPVSDALLMLHGSGASASGPITSTAKSFTGSIATTGVLTITAGVAGSSLLVGDVLTGANIATTTPCIVTGITAITAAAGVGTYTVSAPQLSTSATILATPPLQGDIAGSISATSAYSNLEIDFGAPSLGVSYPWLPAFPSITEKGYTFPPEVVGAGGIQLGVYIVPTAPFYGNSTATVVVDVCSDSTTAATSIIATRTFTVAQLRVQGVRYFIPVNPMQVKEFLRLNWTNNTGYTYVGNIIAYFGPVSGGVQYNDRPSQVHSEVLG